MSVGKLDERGGAMDESSSCDGLCDWLDVTLSMGIISGRGSHVTTHSFISFQAGQRDVTTHFAHVKMATNRNII
jgi:hypothetical protein